MATTSLFPQTLTNPDQSGIAFSGASGTGHSSDAAASSVFRSSGGASASQNKSARWSAFPSAPSGTITAIHLKFDWGVSGSTSVASGNSGSANANASYSLQYSLDGGSNWITVSGQAASDGSGFSASASTDISLSIAQTISNVQVRELSATSVSCFADDSGSAHASASVSSSISSIRLEVTTTDPEPTGATQLLVMM